MPGKIKVKVLAGRNLPVMDRASDTTDAFVEIKFGGVTHKTDVCRKSLNPHWNSTEWYRFEVDESELQDEPLQLRLMDHDTYSANDAIGKVVISLAPLLAREANNVKATGPPGGAVMSGWIPVFDTMHGIRGELNVIVKVELFSDFNKYKTSSCGVQFFHCPMIPPGYRATSVHGFVEELVVNDDPEYQWIDKIRTPRSSNEARQVAFIKLSNQVQRLVGLKAAELGANAVVGYQQEFDLEGEAGVVARAIGTAVSITPLPTPSQQMNIPPCTQQQLKKCLDILATNDESVTDLSQYYSTHREELQKMLSILNPKAPSMLDEPEVNDDDDDRIDVPARSSIHSYTGSASIFQDQYASQKSLRHLSEDQTDLNKLLNRKDDDDSDSSGPIQKIKKLKTNFFTKRFSKRKGSKQDDQISLKSNSSDTSRISLTDIKNELKKRLKKPKVRKVYINNEDEGVGMASILARSVIHAHTSLACIAETQDSEHSPASTMRHTSESEPATNVSDNEMERKISVETMTEMKAELEGKRVPEIHFTSLKNISFDSKEEKPVRERKISDSCPASPMMVKSENLLKLPEEGVYFGSISSALSGDSTEVYSSSEGDDESFDGRSDSQEDFETTSSVVNSVLNHEVNPAFIAQMDKKLSILQNVHPELTEIIRADDIIEETSAKPLETEKKLEENIVKNEPSTSASDTFESKSNTQYIKMHNPFAHKKASKSISAPSSPTEKCSFVYRSSKRIKNQLAKLSKSNMIKSFSHYSLLPKKKQESKTLSHPGSSLDIRSKAPSETVLGSLFLSYSDLLSLDKGGIQVNRGLCKSDDFCRPKVSMYIGSEPVSRSSLSGPSFPFHHKDEHDHFNKKEKITPLKPTGLIHTAMETILMDKVDTLLIPTSPEPDSRNTKQFFDDVTEKLEEHKNRESSGLETSKMKQVQSMTGDTTPRVVAMTPKRFSYDFTTNTRKGLADRKHSLESKGLVDNAMGTILIDKAHTIVPQTPDSIHDDPRSIIDDNPKHKDHKDFLSTIKTSLKDVHLDSVFGLHHGKHDKSKSPDIKSGGLVHTAMQTMLMDRAQSMIPDTPEPTHIKSASVFDFDKPEEATKIHSNESSGLIHSAMETILLDKVQSILPSLNEPVPVHFESMDPHHDKTKQKHETPTKESGGLVHSAMQTILMDKVQSVLPGTVEPAPIHISPKEPDAKSEKPLGTQRKESSGLIHSAMQTILMDKVQSVLPGTVEPVPIHCSLTESDAKLENPIGTQRKESSGLVHSAMQTILMDKIQSVLPDTAEPITTHLGSSEPDMESEKPKGAQLKESSSNKTIEKHDDNADIKSEGLVHSAMEAILSDKSQYLLAPETETETVAKNKPNEDQPAKAIQAQKVEKHSLIQVAMDPMLMDTVQTLYPNFTDPDLKPSVEEFKDKTMTTEVTQKDKTSINSGDVTTTETKSICTSKGNLHGLKSPGLVEIAMKTINKDQPVLTFQKEADNKVNPESSNVLKDTKLKDSQVASPEIKTKDGAKQKKLIRQDSIESVHDSKMSNEDLSNTKVTRAPVLQHFHPILKGLETIPSVSESSFERSLDSEGAFEINSASVCDNSHAACGFDRNDRDRDRSDKDRGSPRHARHESYGGKEPGGTAQVQASLNSTSTPMGIHHRRSSDSDLSVTPKGGSLNTSAGNVGSGGGAILRPSMNADNLDMLEYPFLTMTEYPPGFIVHIGGTVCARSVKLVDGGGESAARAAWWAELRTELRAHARALRCNAVIAYTDTAAICEDVCVLSASGTAVVINLDCDYNAEFDAPITVTNVSKVSTDDADSETCSLAHVPYSPGSGPYRAELSTCGGCRRARVPAVLLATCAKPNRLMSYTKAVTLTAVAARVRRAPPAAEPGARDISDQLPFLEYELHKLLLAKLRMQGANAIFSLQTQIAIGERCVMALASGTAVKLSALPPPSPPRIKSSENDKNALDIQRKLWDSFTANKAANGYDVAGAEHTNGSAPDTDREDPPALDLCADKDACVLELDEAEDVETARMLTTTRVHIQAFTNALRPAVGVPPQAFALVSRARLALGGAGGGGGAARGTERHVARALDAAAYKLRRLAPIALHAALQVELPEDEIQLVVSGTAIPLLDPANAEANSLSENGQTGQHSSGVSHNGTGDADDDIFALDEEQVLRSSHNQELVEEKSVLNGQVPTAVSLTTLSHIPGVRFARRVCALRLLFVRETTAVRELGGLSGFLHTFTCEALAIVRAYAAALGGNALTSFYIRQLMLQDNAHKNQGQCLLSVGGDIVHITY